VRLQAVFYRGHDPRWAFDPLSGDGAKASGGRFNPQGIAALYLASSIEGVFVEMTHGFAHRMKPLTVVSYDVDVEDIIDLRTRAGRRAADVQLTDMACAWLLDLANQRTPASWRMANRLRRTAAGILVPSFANGAREDMHNLVLWKWGEAPHRVAVYDPSGRLPKDQRSWPAGSQRERPREPAGEE
jgi:RES domain-containing protein